MAERRTINLALWAGALILSVGMGLRQSLGLLLSPMNQDLALGLGAFGLAMAIQQLLWGAAQPFAGMLADRFGPMPVLIGGCLCYALGLVTLSFAQSALGVHLSLGVLLGVGVSACSFSLVLGAVTRIVPSDERSKALGFVTAVGSIGQVVAAPISQSLIQTLGWQASLWVFAALILSMAPFALAFRMRGTTLESAGSDIGIDAALKLALKDPSYRLLNFGFFTCGFHVAFIATHLPGQIAACGLPSSLGASALSVIGAGNMIGTYVVGRLGQRVRLKRLLSVIYLFRGILILCFLIAPKTAAVFLAMAALLGASWLSTVPLTSGLVAKLHGPRYVSTLFGLVFFSHQVGGFLGAWLGGVAFDATGSYDPVWLAAAALALLAALAHWPIRETPVSRPLQPSPIAT